MRKISLFANCIPVKGFSRSIIYDIQRHSFKYIPNSLFNIIRKFEYQSLSSVCSNYSKNDHKILKGYLKFLISNEYIFYINENDDNNYIPIDFSYQSSSKLYCVILEYSPLIINRFFEILNELKKLNVKHVYFIFPKLLNIDYVINLMREFSSTRVEAIDLWFDDICGINGSDYVEIFLSSNRIKTINTFGKDNYEDFLNEKNKKYLYNIFCNKAPDSLRNFHINMSFFIEALHYNTYFNKRIFIDYNGNIKNDVKNVKIYGNILESNIESIINNSGIIDLWYAKKDNILTCRDCEYRYMCLDSRIPKRNNENTWCYLDYCKYNPYIAKWEGEDGFCTVEQWRCANPNWEKNAIRTPLYRNSNKT